MSGTRLSLSHDLGMHNGLVVWARPKGDVLVFDGTELVGWHGEELDRGMFSGRASAKLARLLPFWRAALGWDEDALDQVGAYKLVAADGNRTALVGPATRIGERRLPWDPAPHAPEPPDLRTLDPDSMSWRARLQDSPHGVVLCEPELGLVWSLKDGQMWQLLGIDASHSLTAFRTPGGVWVHSSWTERQGFVGWISDTGEVRAMEQLGGSASPFVAVGDSVWTSLCRGLTSHVDLCRLSASDGGIERLTQLPDQVDAAAVHQGRAVVVFTGGTAISYDVTPDGWAEREVLEVPVGNLSRFNTPPSLGQSQARWTGPPGDFSAELRWQNAGSGDVGIRIRVRQSGGVVVSSVRIGERRAAVEEGIATFGQTRIPARGPLRAELFGEVAGPGEVRVEVVGWRRSESGPAGSVADPVLREAVTLGTGSVEVGVESSLVAVRGEARLALAPEWTSQLIAGGAVDREAREPDLERWMGRALRRCRVQTAEEAPAAVRETWLRLSERERTAHSGRLPLYKLQSGQDWVVTEEECAAIRQALSAEHPLAVFSAGGAFRVR